MGQNHCKSDHNESPSINKYLTELEYCWMQNNSIKNKFHHLPKCFSLHTRTKTINIGYI